MIHNRILSRVRVRPIRDVRGGNLAHVRRGRPVEGDGGISWQTLEIQRTAKLKY